MKRPDREVSSGALASIAGGAITVERLTAAAQREGRAGSPLIRSLLAQPLPTDRDLAQAYEGVPRLDPSFVVAATGAARLIDAELLRTHRCLPVAILDDACVLAVCEDHAHAAVQAVRAALRRDVLPAFADGGAIDRALATLAGPPRAARIGAIRPKDSPTQSRFRRLVLGTEALDAVPIERRR